MPRRLTTDNRHGGTSPPLSDACVSGYKIPGSIKEPGKVEQQQEINKHLKRSSGIILSVAQQLSLGLGRLIVEVSKSQAHGRGRLNEWPTCRWRRWLHNTHNRRTSMLSAGFEPTIPAFKRPQTNVLDRKAIEKGLPVHSSIFILVS